MKDQDLTVTFSGEDVRKIAQVVRKADEVNWEETAPEEVYCRAVKAWLDELLDNIQKAPLEYVDFRIGSGFPDFDRELTHQKRKAAQHGGS